MAKKGLGKGLDALLATDGSAALIGGEGDVVELRLTDVEPNRSQPRKQFDEEKLQELADSIATYGVLQPIVVKKMENGFYQLIAGERRWRASRMAGVKTIPALIRSYSDQEAMEIAMIENLQREDLNPIEEARGYQEIIRLFGMKQEELAKKMGKSRPAITNALRLLRLPDSIQEKVIRGELTMGHARALLSIENPEIQERAAGQIVENRLNVRQTEQLLKRLLKEETDKRQKEYAEKPYLLEFEKKMAASYGTKVKINDRNGKGKIEISYYNEEDLERILQLLHVR